MANSKSDKPLVTKVVIFCILAIIGWQWAFAHYSAANYTNGWYIGIMAVLSIVFGYSISQAYKQADSGTKDNSSRGWVIVIAIMILLFIASWAAGANERVAPGSPQMEDAR
jgi:protein-S-isoprenylcysteine O-methyltransferase Ste14